MRRLVIVLACLSALAHAGCAQGSLGEDAGAGGRPDSGRLDARVDARRDAITSVDGASCNDTNGTSCAAPTDLGMLAVDGMTSTGVGYLSVSGQEDWFRIAFPPLNMPNMAGGGTPAINFTRNEGDVFRFEVRGSCSATLSCGMGTGARDLLMWSFTDDASEPGEGAFSTRDVPWPAEVFVRVYSVAGATQCAAYELTVTR
ncbi:MAG: hypothetical protein AAGF12_14780 [Myxococcota bacterium]